MKWNEQRKKNISKTKQNQNKTKTAKEKAKKRESERAKELLYNIVYT